MKDRRLYKLVEEFESITLENPFEQIEVTKIKDMHETYTEQDGFTFNYDPKERIIYYPYEREVSLEVISNFSGYKVQLILF